MSKIQYLVGNAIEPKGKGIKIISHVCNSIGGWGAGFVFALSAKWCYPEQHYRARQTYPLGHADVLKVEDDIYVANMIAQHGVRPNVDGVPPIRYEAVREALIKVNNIAINLDATIHAPRFGSGLSGGNWDIIEQIIKDVVTVDVTIYDLP